MQAFDDNAAQTAFAAHPDWILNLEKGCARRLFQFEDFAQAFGFMAQMAVVSEAMNHHPDVDIRYNRVIVSLSTHDSGGITENDLALAERIVG